MKTALFAAIMPTLDAEASSPAARYRFFFSLPSRSFFVAAMPLILRHHAIMLMFVAALLLLRRCLFCRSADVRSSQTDIF